MRTGCGCYMLHSYALTLCTRSATALRFFVSSVCMSKRQMAGDLLRGCVQTWYVVEGRCVRGMGLSVYVPRFYRTLTHCVSPSSPHTAHESVTAVQSIYSGEIRVLDLGRHIQRQILQFRMNSVLAKACSIVLIFVAFLNHRNF